MNALARGVPLVLVATLATACSLDSGGAFDARGAVDLGVAVYPVGASDPNAATHQWTANLRPSSYRVGYALGAPERAAMRDALQSYARSVGYVPLGKAFRWSPPLACVGDMRCAYGKIAGRSAPDLEPLVQRFAARQRASNLSAADLGALVVTFVQNIAYYEPNDLPFGVLPPALVVAEKRGDCDSKALLALMLLRSFGLDSVLISSQAHAHTMLAIALPSSGTKLTYAGREYALTEMTAAASPIGFVNPSLLSPNDWRVVPVSYTLTPPRAPAPAPKPVRSTHR